MVDVYIFIGKRLRKKFNYKMLRAKFRYWSLFNICQMNCAPHARLSPFIDRLFWAMSIQPHFERKYQTWREGIAKVMNEWILLNDAQVYEWNNHCVAMSLFKLPRPFTHEQSKHKKVDKYNYLNVCNSQDRIAIHETIRGKISGNWWQCAVCVFFYEFVGIAK